MTVYVNETFTDTNGTVLSSHTPDVGGSWSRVAGDQTITIQSNRMGSNSTYGQRVYRNSTGFGSVNQELTCTVYLGGNNPPLYGGPCLRVNSDASFGYILFLELTGAGTGTVCVKNLESGIASIDVISAVSVANGDVLFFSCELLNTSDCTITVKKNGSHITGSPYSHTGTAAANRNNAGYPGLYLHANTNDLGLDQVKYADIGESGAGSSVPIAAISGNLLRMHSGAQ